MLWVFLFDKFVQKKSRRSGINHELFYNAA